MPADDDRIGAGSHRACAGHRASAPARVELSLCRFHDLDALSLYQCLQLRSAVFVLEQQCLYQDIDGADLQAMHLLVKRQQQLLGYGRLLPPDTHTAVRIGRIVIAAGQRGSGHGRWLIDLLRACAARQWPGRDIELSAQTHLQDLYRRCGFRPISAPYDEDGISHIDMRWQSEG